MQNITSNFVNSLNDGIWQKKGGATGVVEWGTIMGDIRDQEDLMALLGSFAPKEVVSVLTASSTAPVSDPDSGFVLQEGDYYINIDEEKLYQYNDSEWQQVDAYEETIYITDDTHHTYVLQDNEFVDITGEGSVLYVTNLTTDLAPYTDSGFHKVCLVPYGQQSEHWYNMVVTRTKRRSGSVYIYTAVQVLYDQSGYRTRSKSWGGRNDGLWTDWDIKTYAIQEEIMPIIEDMMPLIYAGL